MARDFKPITGNITKLNAPYFAEQRGLWVMMVKENDRWIAINSRNEEKIRGYHALLETRKAAQTLNLSVQPTTLTHEKVKMAEFAYGVLGDVKPNELVDAANLLREQKLKLKVPTVIEAANHFLEKQEKRQLSDFTMRDYRRLVRHLTAEFPTQRLSDITSSDLTRFIEKADHIVKQRSRYIYLKAFIQFCGGKHNSLCNGVPWLSPLILQWQQPKTEAKEVTVYRYDQIVALLKEASKKSVLPYFVFRLFSMMRTEEMKRFTDIHPKVSGHPLVSLEAKRISITNQIFKKRSDTNHRGRFFNDLHPTFLAWLEHFAASEESIECTDEIAQKIKVSIGIPVEARNLLRHTAITYHCLAFKNPLHTAFVAGNSVGIIQNHYLNMNVPVEDVLKLYELTPSKAKELGIL